MTMTIHRDNSTLLNDPHQAANPPNKQRRILLLSLEFNYSPFSGNGVLARSLVSSLVRRNDCLVRVICARPHSSTPALSKDVCLTNNLINNNDSCGNYGGDLEIWPVNLPKECQWKRLDRDGPWKEFANGCGDDRLGYAKRVRDFGPTEVVAVDWHGIAAWEALCNAISYEGMDMPTADATKERALWQTGNAIVCYYNFRVYSSSSWEHSSEQSDDNGAEQQQSDDDAFYVDKEQLSCKMADVIVCLSEHDKSMLQKLIHGYNEESQEPIVERKIKNIHILYPPLRGDIWELASKNKDLYRSNSYLPPEAKMALDKVTTQQSSSTQQQQQQRVFITCMVRLSPEKSPHHFVTLLQKLGGVDFLKRNALIPVICGARSVEEYAAKVVNDLKKMCLGSCEEDAWPCVIIDRHLGPKELAAIFSRTLVNVHPSLYDAYGMTLVESAAFGAPSIVNHRGKVGAVSLLGEENGCVAVDMEKLVSDRGDDSNNHVVKRIVDSIQNLSGTMDECINLRQIAEVARSQALGWDEMACCQEVINILNNTQKQCL